MALFQRELAEAVSVPVFSSSLIQVPLVRAMLHGGRTIGVMTASAQSLIPAHFEAVGADIDTVEIVGMDDYCEFREVILEAKRDDMDLDVIEAEMPCAAVSMPAPMIAPKRGSAARRCVLPCANCAKPMRTIRPSTSGAAASIPQPPGVREIGRRKSRVISARTDCLGGTRLETPRRDERYSTAP